MNKPKRIIINSIIYLIVLMTLISLSSLIKIHNFGDGKLYYSDAALRFHYAEMYNQGKKIPTIDKQVLYPEGLRVRTLIHLTLDWIIGNSHRILFPKIPFTDYVKYFVSIFSSLSILLVFLLGKAIWQRKESGLIAAIFYAIGIASFWRITGNYLREEFALPFIFASLYLFTKTIRNNSRNRHQNLFLIFSGLSLAIALISWHLTQFFFSVFALFLIFFFIFNNEPIKTQLFKKLWLFLIFPIIAGIIWEPIRSKYFIISFPVVISSWLCFISIVFSEHNLNSFIKRILSALSIIPIYVIIMYIFPKYFTEYGHVFETIIAKIIHLGKKPANPATLSFDARSIWIGPFVSPGPFSIYFSMLVPFILAIIGWLGSLKRNFFKRFDYNRLLLSFFIIAFTTLYLLVIRLEVFLFFFLAVAIGGILNLILNKIRLWRLLLLILIAGFLIESYKTLNYSKLFERYYLKLSKEWLTKPTAYGTDWESLTNWIKDNTKPDDAILADVDISAMLLAYIGRPIIIEPIYENAITRQRVKECLSVFYQNESDFLKLIKEYQVNYIVYQQDFLLDNSKESNRYLTDNMKVNKSSVAYLMHFQPESLKNFILKHQTNTFRIYQEIAENELKPSSPQFPYSPYFDLSLFDQDSKNEFFDDSNSPVVEKLIFQALDQYNLATQLIQQNDYQNAIKHLESVLNIFPDFERAYYYLGLSYQKLSYIQQALFYLDKAINSYPNDMDAYLTKASILDGQNNLPEAVATIISAIKIKPNRTDLFSNLGYFYIKRQQIDDGLATFKTLAESLPPSSPLHLYTGYLYAFKNDLTNAEAEFNQALAIDSTNPEIYEAFGSLYLQKKEFEKAITYFEKSLKLNPDQPQLKSQLAELKKRFR